MAKAGNIFTPPQPRRHRRAHPRHAARLAQQVHHALRVATVPRPLQRRQPRLYHPVRARLRRSHHPRRKRRHVQLMVGAQNKRTVDERVQGRI